MQVTETLSQGLKREFKVVLPAAELEERLTTELTALKDKVRINGFRPGKVPVAHLRKLYGRSVMKDVLATALNEAERKIVEENDLRLANPPRYDFPEDQAVLEQAADAKIDLAVTVGMEVLPSFELADLSDVSLRKLVAPVSETDLQDALERMARQNRTFSSKAEDAAAETGDRVVIDFTGTVEGKPFQGGDGKGIPVELGSGSFMPGFEEQLAGVRAGERRSVQITFPPNYLREDLAGKDAVFDVTVSAVEAPSEIKIDDELAKSFGMETLERLKDAARAAIERDFAVRSRTRLKKQFLDALDAKYGFELPPSLVEQEFAGVWAQVEADMKDNGKTFADEGTTEEEARTEYRRISERRVRLGLVLARMGEDADISVSDEEVNRALAERIRMYPAQDRKRVWDYYQKDPQARAQIRAPLFEEKVVDHLLSLVKVVEEPVAKEVLFQDDEDEDGKPAEAASKPTP